MARRSRSYPQAPADVPKPVAHFTATVAKRGRRALVQNSPFGSAVFRGGRTRLASTTARPPNRRRPRDAAGPAPADPRSTDPRDRENTMASNTEKNPRHRPRSVRTASDSHLPRPRFPAGAHPRRAAWGCRPSPRRPGELLTRGDVCHVHADRAAAERCGVLLARRARAGPAR